MPAIPSRLVVLRHSTPRDRLVARAFGLILLAASSGFLVLLASAWSNGRNKSPEFLGTALLAVLFIALLVVPAGWRLTFRKFHSIIADPSKQQLFLRETSLLSCDDWIIDADRVAEVVMFDENQRLNDGYSEIHNTVFTLVARLKDGETIELLWNEAPFATPAHAALRAHFEEMRAATAKALGLDSRNAIAPVESSPPGAISKDGVRP